MNAHTSGPWSIYLRDRVVAEVRHTGMHGVLQSEICDLRHGCNSEANARLIAAAPELLALVYQYRDDMRHGVDALGWRGRRLEAIEAVLLKVEERP